MKKSSRMTGRALTAFSRIHLVDKCLLLFMLILLLQSAFSLFVNRGASSEADHIDVIVRTSSAAIFGYFLSANFAQRFDGKRNKSAATARGIAVPGVGRDQSGVPQNRIGFVPPDVSPEQKSGSAADTVGAAAPACDQEMCDENCLPIITVTAIGIFCLTVLVMVRNFVVWDSSMGSAATATVAQLRDFVSGSVGFLIGCPTSGTERAEK